MKLIDPIKIRRTTLAEIIDLRHAILRAGLPRETAVFTGDDLATTRHYGAFATTDSDERTVGCASFHLNPWENEPAWQLRGMATADEFRGQGLGRAVLEFAGGDLPADPASPRVLWCNGRVPAIGFYERMGWKVVSKAFEVPTAGPHVKMLRRLLG